MCVKGFRFTHFFVAQEIFKKILFFTIFFNATSVKHNRKCFQNIDKGEIRTVDKDFFLIRKMKNGDEDAMDSFVRKYYEKILNYCYYHSSDRQNAENLTQDTFVKFFASLPGYKHSGKAMNFLYTIARNLCIDFNRREKERLAKTTELAEEAAICDDMKNAEARMDVNKAVIGLSEDIREVIILYYFHGLNTREIAELLKIGLPLVKYRIKTGKEKLRTILGKEDIA